MHWQQTFSHRVCTHVCFFTASSMFFYIPHFLGKKRDQFSLKINLKRCKRSHQIHFPINFQVSLETYAWNKYVCCAHVHSTFTYAQEPLLGLKQKKTVFFFASYMFSTSNFFCDLFFIVAIDVATAFVLAFVSIAFGATVVFPSAVVAVISLSSLDAVVTVEFNSLFFLCFIVCLLMCLKNKIQIKKEQDFNEATNWIKFKKKKPENRLIGPGFLFCLMMAFLICFMVQLWCTEFVVTFFFKQQQQEWMKKSHSAIQFTVTRVLLIKSFFKVQNWHIAYN